MQPSIYVEPGIAETFQIDLSKLGQVGTSQFEWVGTISAATVVIAHKPTTKRTALDQEKKVIFISKYEPFRVDCFSQAPKQAAPEKGLTWIEFQTAEQVLSDLRNLIGLPRRNSRGGGLAPWMVQVRI